MLFFIIQIQLFHFMYLTISMLNFRKYKFLKVYNLWDSKQGTSSKKYLNFIEETKKF